MQPRRRVGSFILLTALFATGGGIVAWKHASVQQADAAMAAAPEPAEPVTAAIVTPRAHRPTTTSIGTVLALRSITLRNELPGTVDEVMLTPGEIVEAGTVLVALDVSVEQAELAAFEAQATLATTLLERARRLHESRAVAVEEVDRARAEHAVARAHVARTEAVIARKTIRAPFRARIGLADVHPGQYLNEGTVLTTLQGVDAAVHVDFTVAQQVAAGLREGDEVTVSTGTASFAAAVVALDARVDPETRNAAVRARVADTGFVPGPGASVRVTVPAGPPVGALAIPVSALRKDPSGEHVFVLAPDATGQVRAQRRVVDSGATLGDEVLIYDGLDAGERVAASGSFKLRDSALVTVDGPIEHSGRTGDIAGSLVPDAIEAPASRVF